MSMHNYANHGHLVKILGLHGLAKELSPKAQDQLDGMLDSGAENEEIASFINTHLPKQFPRVADVFYVGGDDIESFTGDTDEWYAFISESGLFAPRVKTDTHKLLNCHGIEVEEHQWVTWG